MVGLAVELNELVLEVVALRPHDLLHAGDVAEHAVPAFRHEHQVGVQRNARCQPSVQAVLVGPEPYGVRVQLRYAYRLNPTPGQGIALARAFGCARVVFNDAIAARRAAHDAGAPFPTDAALSKALTAAKRTPTRAWLAEVSAVVLQQALADASTAYRNFFASVKGARKGRRLGAPRFRSKRDRAQSIRFTRAARFRVDRGGPVAAARDRGRPGPLVAGAAGQAVERDGHGGRDRPVPRLVRRRRPRRATPGERPRGGHRPGPRPLRGPVGRPEGRKPAHRPQGRLQAAPGTAGTGPPPARLEEPGQGRAEGRTVSCPGRRYPPGLAAQAVDHHRSGEPTDRGGRPRRGGPGPAPGSPAASPMRAGRRSCRCSRTSASAPGARS